MALVHILDRKTDEIIGTLNSDKAEFWEAIRHDSVDGQNTFDFTANALLEKSADLQKRNRLVIQDEDGFFREYIINYAEQFKRNEKKVSSDASFVDIAKAKVIEPQTLTGTTAVLAAQLALGGTEWQPGEIESTDTQTITIDKYTNPLDLIKTIASTFGLETSYRVEISGNKITGRYVDMKSQIAGFEGKEITFGKDLISVKRKEDSSRIVTALLGVYKQQDGTFIKAWVEDADAFQRWGRNGQHLVDYYEPETSSDDMTADRLISLTKAELKRRIDASVTYEGEAASIEHVFGREHEKIRCGQTVRIKDIGYSPPLYLEARIQEVEIDQITKQIKSYKIGNFKEYSKAELEKQIATLKQLLADKASHAQVAEVKKEAAAQAQQAEEKAKKYADTASTTAENNAKEVARAMALGKMLHTDPIFRNGLNGISLYNNSGGGTVTLSRITSPAGTPNTSGYAIQIQTTGAPTSPGFGGFTFSTKTRANAIFIVRIVANIPVGYTINWASNATGSGGNATSKWLTPNVGTGKWEEYVYKLVCGDSGTFRTSNYFYLRSGPATFPITWYLAYATVFDVTDNDYMALDTKALTDGWKYPNTTYIDGGNIYTGTITANKIASKSITANEIASGAITANEIASGAITADKMNVNSLSAISANLGNVTAGSMQGVTLTLGGTNNQNGVLVVYNSAGEKVIDIDANDGGFDKLIVGQLICDSVPKINNADLNFYVDPAGDDANDGLSWSTPKKTIQACIDLIPKINNGNVTITCKYPPGSNRQDFYGDVILKGFTGAGSITIEGQIWYNYINGKIFASGCTNRIYIRNFTVNYTDASAGYAVFANACTYFSCYYVWVYGQNRAGSAFVAVEGTNMFLDYCEGYDCNFVINAQKRSDVMVSRCKGYGTQYGLVAQWGSWIMIYSTYPGGGTKEAYVDSGGTISYNGATVNNGAKGAPPPSKTTQQWITTNGNNWGTMYGWANDGVRTGNYGYGERTGFYNFGTAISSVLQGKTIKSMRVWVQRKSSGGASGETPIYVRYHNYTSQPAGQPAMSSAYARIDLAWGKSGWVTLPQAFLDAFSNGSAKGIGLWANSSSYQYYSVMTNECRVEATYQ